MAGARNFDFVAVGSRGIPPFEIGINGSVAAGYQHPAWLASPRSRGDYCFEIVRFVQHLRPRHERGVLSRQVGCEVLMKLSGVKVGAPQIQKLRDKRIEEALLAARIIVFFVVRRIFG